MRGLRGIATLAGLALVGCARPNPAYQEPGGSTSDGTASTTTGVTEGDSTTALSGDGPDPDTSTGVAACEFGPPPTPYEIRTGDMDPLPDGCSGGDNPPPLFYQLDGAPMNGGTLVSGNACTTCSCDRVLNAELMLSFDVPLPPFEGNECITIERAYDSSGPGSCQLTSYAIRQDNDLLSIVSNVVSPAVSDGWIVTRTDDPLDDCPDECSGDPIGNYGLVFSIGSELVEVGPQEMDISVGDYRVTNEHSYIDDQCRSVFRWHARRMPA